MGIPRDTSFTTAFCSLKLYTGWNRIFKCYEHFAKQEKKRKKKITERPLKYKRAQISDMLILTSRMTKG